MFYPHEYRDLGKGWYAVKLPTERKWTLRRTSSYTDYVKGSIRELEGVLTTLITQAQFRNTVLTVNDVKLLIRNNIKILFCERSLSS